jgi:hypothetical protein
MVALGAIKQASPHCGLLSSTGKMRAITQTFKTADLQLL